MDKSFKGQFRLNTVYKVTGLWYNWIFDIISDTVASFERRHSFSRDRHIQSFGLNNNLFDILWSTFVIQVDSSVPDGIQKFITVRELTNGFHNAFHIHLRT